MEMAAEIIFDAINIGLKTEPALFNKLRLWFIGTSYAQAGKGDKTMEPIAKRKGLERQVTEITDRIPYFETLYLLSKADILCVPGSSDPTYTASKIYPYIYTNKPMLAVFHENSSVVEVMKLTSKGKMVTFGDTVNETIKQRLANECFEYLLQVMNNNINNSSLNYEAFEEYTAKAMAGQQISFFEQVLNKDSVAN